MSFLSNFRGGSLSCADSPDGFIGDDDLGPILDTPLDCIELYLKHIMSVALFSLFKVLPYANNRMKAVLLAPLNLLRYNLVSFKEVLSSFAVPNDDPMKAEILNLLSTHLPSVTSCGSC